MVLPGAFRESLRVDNVEFVFVNHDDQWSFGSTGEGTLKLLEDHRGLRFELASTPGVGGDFLVGRVRDGAYPGASFRFGLDDAEWENYRGERVRLLKTVSLRHICPALRPAYLGTSIQIEGAG
jgi:hypothetical protein